MNQVEFLDNKYKRWYFEIIKRARKRKQPDEYFEKHHVLPKCFGGNNKRWNIVKLTYREHVLVHWLLTKMTEGQNKKKMIWALFNMSGVNYVYGQPRTPPKWLFDLTKKVTKGARNGENNAFYGKTHSKESRVKIKEKRKSQVNLAFGENHGIAKLTEQKVLQIRLMKSEGKTISFIKKVLAKDGYVVCSENISKILRGITWRHLLNKRVWATPSIVEITEGIN